MIVRLNSLLYLRNQTYNSRKLIHFIDISEEWSEQLQMYLGTFLETLNKSIWFWLFGLDGCAGQTLTIFYEKEALSEEMIHGPHEKDYVGNMLVLSKLSTL